MLLSRKRFLKIWLTGFAGVPLACHSDQIPGFISFSEDNISELFTGDTIVLHWTSYGVSKLNVFISYDLGIAWQLIGRDIKASSGQFEHQLSDNATTIVFFMIQDTNNHSILDISQSVTVTKAVFLQLDDEKMQRLLTGAVITTFHPDIKEITLQIEEEERVRIIGLECPHNGCTVEFISATQKHECPCHGSAFSRFGCLMRGPAEVDLKCYQGKLDINTQIIKIDLQTEEGKC